MFSLVLALLTNMENVPTASNSWNSIKDNFFSCSYQTDLTSYNSAIISCEVVGNKDRLSCSSIQSSKAGATVYFPFVSPSPSLLWHEPALHTIYLHQAVGVLYTISSTCKLTTWSGVQPKKHSTVLTVKKKTPGS